MIKYLNDLDFNFSDEEKDLLVSIARCACADAGPAPCRENILYFAVEPILAEIAKWPTLSPAANELAYRIRQEV